jgi:2-keto-3-deoxy-L-rhamnonate aldolase RhmA
MGMRDQIESPPFVEALKRVVAAAKNRGKAAGILVHNAALVPKCRDWGFTFVALGSDGGAVRAGLQGFHTALRAK